MVAGLNRPICLENCFLSNFPLGSQVARAPSFGSLYDSTSCSLSVAALCVYPTFALFWASLWQRIDFVLALSQQHIKLLLTFLQQHLNFTPGLALQWRFMPMPCLTIYPWPQHLRLCSGGSFSPTNELDATSALASAGAAPMTNSTPPRSYVWILNGHGLPSLASVFATVSPKWSRSPGLPRKAGELPNANVLFTAKLRKS